MLTAADFIRAHLKRLHKGLDKALAELTPEQLHTVPAGHSKANTIGWGSGTTSAARGQHRALGDPGSAAADLDRGRLRPEAGAAAAAQGTGMSTEEAQALRIKDIPLFQEYTQKVWAGTEELFGAATPELLGKTGDGQAARGWPRRTAPRCPPRPSACTPGRAGYP